MTRPRLPFSRKLVVHRWLLGLFGCETFDQLAANLRDEALEGLDADNVHRLHRALRLHVPEQQRSLLPDDRLLEHDQTIVGVTQRLNRPRIKRGEPELKWKYFQYLSLLFTEIYLDRYFEDPAGLLAELASHAEQFNASLPEAERVAAFNPDGDPATQLNKVAFQMATGSGKTLLMHANILQYRRHLKAGGRIHTLNRMILLTPNEGLSRQHIREFRAAGINAELFNRNGSLLSGAVVEVLDVHKLRDENDRDAGRGEKTVPVEAFEGNNLVLVDEGHRGASSGRAGAWIRRRDELCADGFSFEYSATFAQAVKGNRDLTDRYARATLFDYSYRWFHDDGFGKDFKIFNLEEKPGQERGNELWRTKYLTAALLTFFQQQHLFREGGSALRPYNLERPLWVFVGSRVVAGFSTKEASDIADILGFLANYVSDRVSVVSRIREILADGLVASEGKDLFKGQFVALKSKGLSADAVYDETLQLLFNAPDGGSLHIARLEGAQGELALTVGDNEPFGVINVGDPAKLAKHLDGLGFRVVDGQFAGSLFHGINNDDSTVNLLVGAKKFNEGWNSWRVSSMGLMRVGSTEGATIIQLFGRGVRLKGRDWTLKRSSRLGPALGKPPVSLNPLETLQVFGVRANYMAQFRAILEEEGLDTERKPRFVPVTLEPLPAPALKVIRLKETVAGTDPASAFTRIGPNAILRPPGAGASPEVDTYLLRHPVVVDWYPKIRVRRSEGAGGESVREAPHQGLLTRRHVEHLDLDELFIDLQRHKVERGWHNLTVSQEAIRALLDDSGEVGSSWYRLRIPALELEFDDYGKVRVWRDITLALLKKYAARFYAASRQAWEARHLEYRDLDYDDPSYPAVAIQEALKTGYEIEIGRSGDAEADAEIAAAIDQLIEDAEAGRRDPHQHGDVRTISFDRHLYRPLLSTTNNSLARVSPAPLNCGEYTFVQDLERFCADNRDRLDGINLHLMRNMSRGRGLSFFEASNFHPDFILWATGRGCQRIAFIDPKGMRQEPPHGPKVRFHEKIKEIERRLGDPTVTLDSCIVSVTSFADLKNLWSENKTDLAKRNIFFQEDRATYISDILTAIGVPAS